MHHLDPGSPLIKWERGCQFIFSDSQNISPGKEERVVSLFGEGLVDGLNTIQSWLILEFKVA